MQLIKTEKIVLCVVVLIKPKRPKSTIVHRPENGVRMRIIFEDRTFMCVSTFGCSHQFIYCIGEILIQSSIDPQSIEVFNHSDVRKNAFNNAGTHQWIHKITKQTTNSTNRSNNLIYPILGKHLSKHVIVESRYTYCSESVVYMRFAITTRHHYISLIRASDMTLLVIKAVIFFLVNSFICTTMLHQYM